MEREALRDAVVRYNAEGLKGLRDRPKPGRPPALVALHSPVADKGGQHRLEGGDAEGLLDLIVHKRSQAEEKPSRPVRVACCFEAGYDGFWLHR